MTDRNRAKKTEFGADEEADKILGKLPRNPKKGPNAIAWINASGALEIAIEGGGILSIKENDLYKVHGDELV